jgi:hypothetical protein
MRDCEYCGERFRKPPKYATCGHPICVRKHRNFKRTVQKYVWKPPEIYSSDKKTRDKVWKYLSGVQADSLSPGLVMKVAVQAKLKPVEVIEIWKSMKKEKESAS